MSGGLEVLGLKQDDVTKMLAACIHLGANNANHQMKDYVYKRRADGVNIIHVRRTWEKLLLAARAIVAIENAGEVFAISSRTYGQRAVLKYAAHTGATPIAGRFTPGAFTNQIQSAFREPRLLIVTDPLFDHQPITEASYVNIPVIAFCNVDSPKRYVDIAIPCNNKSPHSIGLMWWFLAREVLRLRGLIKRDVKWDVVVDLYFYREPEEAEKEELAAKELAPAKTEVVQPLLEAPVDDWGAPEQEQWNVEPPVVVPVVLDVSTSSDSVPYVAPVANDWATQVANDWAANAIASQPIQPNWGGTQENWN